jgi:hypothetical protein
MRSVSDAFLLLVAEISATLVGLFLVGVFTQISRHNARPLMVCEIGTSGSVLRALAHHRA